MWESHSLSSSKEIPFEISDGLLHVKAPPAEIKNAVENFEIEAFDPWLFPEAKVATEKLRQELVIFDFRRSPTIHVTEDSKLLFKAIDGGDMATFLRLIENGAITAQDSEGKSPLHHAVIHQQLPILNHLLSSKTLQFDLNHADTFGRTALHFASFTKKPESQLVDAEKSLMVSIASLLIGDPRAEVDHKDRKGRTPLSIAARAGLFSVVSMLLSRGANPNLSNEEGRTALHFACLQGYANVVECLLDAGAWIEAQDRVGFRAIHFAAHGNQHSIVRLLLKFGANPNCLSYSGKTPMALASEFKDIKWLLEGRKTSYTEPYEIDWISHPVLGPSRVGVSMCPGRNEGNWRRTFDMDIDVIKQNKIDTVVTTLTQGELDYMGMRDLPKRFPKHGIEAIWFPLDQWIPTDVDALVQLMEALVVKLTNGTSILIHCNGRRGRVGMVAVAILIALGVSQDEAIKTVRSIRSGILSNPAHLVFISAFESAWKKNKDKESGSKVKSFSDILSDLF